MLYEDEGVLVKLRGMATRLTRDTWLQDDLIQEARAHLCREEELHPHETLSWHLQGCLFAMRSYLKRGRSVDSWKHGQGWSPLPDESDSPTLPEEFLEHFDSVRGPIALKELIASLTPLLRPAEHAVLLELAKDVPVKDIARKYGHTHQQVTRLRQRIEAVAMNQGYSVPPARPASSPPPAVG